MKIASIILVLGLLLLTLGCVPAQTTTPEESPAAVEQPQETAPAEAVEEVKEEVQMEPMQEPMKEHKAFERSQQKGM